jgi:hypothetical protein
MAPSGTTRIVRTSGYAAAAGASYAKHEGGSQGRKPRGRGAWRSEGVTQERAATSRGNPLARSRAAPQGARNEGHTNRRHQTGGRTRGARQSSDGTPRGGNSGREAAAGKPRSKVAAPTSGALNDDLDAYFNGDTPVASTATPGTVEAAAAPKSKGGGKGASRSAAPAASAGELDDMLDSYMAASAKAGAEEQNGAAAGAPTQGEPAGDESPSIDMEEGASHD